MSCHQQSHRLDSFLSEFGYISHRAPHLPVYDGHVQIVPVFLMPPLVVFIEAIHLCD